MLKRSAGTGHPCLVPNYDIICRVFFVDILYQVEVSFYFKFTEDFCHEWVLDFVKHCFCIYWYDHVFFLL